MTNCAASSVSPTSTRSRTRTVSPSWIPRWQERSHMPRIIAAVLAAFVSLVAASSLSVAQSPADGKALFEKRCGGCHALDRDKEGPRLGGVYGRIAGTVASFQYSDALKSSGIKWNEETLDK